MRPISRLVLALTASMLIAGTAAAKPELDAAGKCRDITTKKFAKCGSPNTEPVPGSSPSEAKKPK